MSSSVCWGDTVEKLMTSLQTDIGGDAQTARFRLAVFGHRLGTEWSHSIDWGESRPMDFPHAPPRRFGGMMAQGLRMTLDCSATVTLAFWLSNVADPNGLAYNGYGYTGTLLQHLPAHRPSDPILPGALCVFGPGSGDHVVMALGRGTVEEPPLVLSHGSELGLWIDSWQWVASGFSESRWLSISHLLSEPPPRR